MLFGKLTRHGISFIIIIGLYIFCVILTWLSISNLIWLILYWLYLNAIFLGLSACFFFRYKDDIFLFFLTECLDRNKASNFCSFTAFSFVKKKSFRSASQPGISAVISSYSFNIFLGVLMYMAASCLHQKLSSIVFVAIVLSFIPR